MVETLTDNNLTLEEEIRTLRENVADLVSFATDIIRYPHSRQYMFCNPSNQVPHFTGLCSMSSSLRRSKDCNQQKKF